MYPEALQGSWRIPYVAVPIVRMTGRPAIIKRRQALAVAKVVALSSPLPLWERVDAMRSIAAG